MATIKAGDLHIGYKEARPGADKDATGEAIVFLHGVGSDKSAWDVQVEYFSQTSRAVALDYPGYGESDAPAHDLNREEVVRYLLSVMEELKITRAHVIGLSMGSILALEMYQQNAQCIRSLVLANAFARHPEAEPIIERSRRAVAAMTMREFAERRVESIMSPHTPSALRHEAIETMARIDKRTYLWASVAVWAADYRDFLPSIKIPTLVVTGELDQITPQSLSEELCAGIRGAELEMICAAGHLSNIENPLKFNALVREFIDKTEKETRHLLTIREHQYRTSNRLLRLSSHPPAA